MAWLQKRPLIGDSIQFYTTGLTKTVLIVGLGNPGKEYKLTRHNIGFECVDAFVAANAEFEPWVAKKDLKCELTSGRLGENRVIVIKPTTFMNLSGEAVQAVASFYKVTPEFTVVIHDELDINFGQIRTRNEGSAAGHNGLKSLIQHLGENFARIRIGIGPKTPANIDSADFVLQKFSAAEQAELPNLTREVSVLLGEYIYSGTLPHDTRSFLI